MRACALIDRGSAISLPARIESRDPRQENSLCRIFRDRFVSPWSVRVCNSRAA